MVLQLMSLYVFTRVRKKRSACIVLACIKILEKILEKVLIMKWLDKLKHTPSLAMSAAKDIRNECRVPYDAILKRCELYNSKRKKRKNIVRSIEENG